MLTVLGLRCSHEALVNSHSIDYGPNENKISFAICENNAFALEVISRNFKETREDGSISLSGRYTWEYSPRFNIDLITFDGNLTTILPTEYPPMWYSLTHGYDILDYKVMVSISLDFEKEKFDSRWKLLTEVNGLVFNNTDKTLFGTNDLKGKKLSFDGSNCKGGVSAAVTIQKLETKEIIHRGRVRTTIDIRKDGRCADELYAMNSTVFLRHGETSYYFSSGKCDKADFDTDEQDPGSSDDSNAGNFNFEFEGDSSEKIMNAAGNYLPIGVCVLACLMIVGRLLIDIIENINRMFCKRVCSASSSSGEVP